jgi:hypothetical protein
MVIHDNEVLGPEHLAELGTLFDRAWAAFGSATCEPEADERAQLACILLRLYGLRQLGPEQLTRTALRLMKQLSPEAMSDSVTEDTGGRPELVGSSAVSSAATNLGLGGT